MKYVDEWGNVLVPTRRLGPHAPHVDQIDSWVGTVACDLVWAFNADGVFSDQRYPGILGRYWRVLDRNERTTTLEWLA